MTRDVSNRPETRLEVKKPKTQFLQGRTRVTIPLLSTSLPGVLLNLSRKVKQSPTLTIGHIFNTIKDPPWVRHPTRPLTSNPRGPRSRDYCTFHEVRVHFTVDYRTFRRHLQDLVNERYLREFILNSDYPRRSECRGSPRPQTNTRVAPSSNIGR